MANPSNPEDFSFSTGDFEAALRAGQERARQRALETPKDYKRHADQPKPFVPQSMAYPKKKAKLLRELVPGMALSACQQAVAKALAWKDWFALEQAVARGQPPSPSDDDLDDPYEPTWRELHQYRSLLSSGVPYDQVADVAEALQLTQAAPTFSEWATDALAVDDEDWATEEVAPGLYLAHDMNHDYYRLSPELEAKMIPALRFPHADGWYMQEDEAWRVILSFPHLFSTEEAEEARAHLRSHQPLLAELLGEAVEPIWQAPSIAARKKEALKYPNAWFPISAFEQWAIRDAATMDNRLDPEDPKLVVHSAIRGKDLLTLIGRQGVWDRSFRPEVAWFAMQRKDSPVTDLQNSWGMGEDAPESRLTGRKGWRHAPVCIRPYKLQPFELNELRVTYTRSFTPLVDGIDPGTPEVIE